jgi:ankyrin repeat protein
MELLFSILLNNHAQTHFGDDKGKSPLHLAVELNHEGIFQQLLTVKADVNVRDDSGHSPIELAFKSGKAMMAMKMLVDEPQALGTISQFAELFTD